MYGSEKRDVKGVKGVKLLIDLARGGTKTACKGEKRREKANTKGE
jgi:hypothetical protein